jgi:hypothetical protein
MLSSNPARTTLVDTFFTDFPLPKDKGAAIFSRHPNGTPTITILEPLLCNTLCERPKRQDQVEVNTTVLIRDTAMARHGGDQRERPKKKKNPGRETRVLGRLQAGRKTQQIPNGEFQKAFRE